MPKITMELKEDYRPGGELYMSDFDFANALTEKVINKFGLGGTVSVDGNKYILETEKPIDPLVLFGFKQYFSDITEEKK